MPRIGLALLLASAAFAQEPPPDVDRALRARISEFYQYHVSEQYRKAEAMVAEESKDLYYVASKPHYLGFEIQKIEYRENFTKARVTVQVEQRINSPFFGGKPLKMPSTSSWKLIGGQWYFYVDEEELRRGPMGPMNSTRSDGKDAGPSKPEDIKIATTPDFALGKVVADKKSVVLKPGGTAELTITNGMPGRVSLVLFQILPGITVHIEKANLDRGEKTRVTLTGGENPNMGYVAFEVRPTFELVAVEIKRQ